MSLQNFPYLHIVLLMNALHLFVMLFCHPVLFLLGIFFHDLELNLKLVYFLFQFFDLLVFRHHFVLKVSLYVPFKAKLAKKSFFLFLGINFCFFVKLFFGLFLWLEGQCCWFMSFLGLVKFFSVSQVNVVFLSLKFLFQCLNLFSQLFMQVWVLFVELNFLAFSLTCCFMLNSCHFSEML